MEPTAGSANVSSARAACDLPWAPMIIVVVRQIDALSLPLAMRLLPMAGTGRIARRCTRHGTAFMHFHRPLGDGPCRQWIVRNAAGVEVYVPLSLAPGEACQFDWCHEVVLIN